MFDPNAEKTVYFVRHGQSEDNIAPVFQSEDSPLTEKGRAQAESIAERAVKIPFDVLISSPLPRARDTADAISKSVGKVVEYSDFLVEAIKPTGLAGKSYSDSDADAIWKQWYKSQSDPAVRAGDGENYTDFIARADKALEYLLSRPEKRLMVVTHGYFLRTLLIRVMLGDSLTSENFRNFQAQASMENTGISVVQYGKGFQSTSPRWKLWIYNDHAHLG